MNLTSRILFGARLAAVFLISAVSVTSVLAAPTTYSYRQAMPGVTAEPPVPPTPPADVQPSTEFTLPGSNAFYQNRIQAKVPFTISAWVNVTNPSSNGYLLSLSDYYNYGAIHHAGIVVKNGMLAYDRTYRFNSFNWGSIGGNIQPMPVGSWTHITAQVDSEHMLKVAVNGRFVYSEQLSSYLRATDAPEAGGILGFGDPNAFIFPSTSMGTIKQVQVWKSLVYNGTDFTPPPLK